MESKSLPPWVKPSKRQYGYPNEYEKISNCEDYKRKRHNRASSNGEKQRPASSSGMQLSQNRTTSTKSDKIFKTAKSLPAFGLVQNNYSRAHPNLPRIYQSLSKVCDYSNEFNEETEIVEQCANDSDSSHTKHARNKNKKQAKDFITLNKKKFDNRNLENVLNACNTDIQGDDETSKKEEQTKADEIVYQEYTSKLSNITMNSFDTGLNALTTGDHKNATSDLPYLVFLERVRRDLLPKPAISAPSIPDAKFAADTIGDLTLKNTRPFNSLIDNKRAGLEKRHEDNKNEGAIDERITDTPVQPKCKIQPIIRQFKPSRVMLGKPEFPCLSPTRPRIDNNTLGYANAANTSSSGESDNSEPANIDNRVPPRSEHTEPDPVGKEIDRETREMVKTKAFTMGDVESALKVDLGVLNYHYERIHDIMKLNAKNYVKFCYPVGINNKGLGGDKEPKARNINPMAYRFIKFNDPTDMLRRPNKSEEHSGSSDGTL
ncbi:unnamed protein product [Owenia fusiformis]|uniref:Uncharacterized protein n=1 Tax=Owenia fusiformis TaxID=6347 RepID=A0A8S4Q992_OWEFU|nr:unnamed protein product [Owenia fusiformis]